MTLAKSEEYSISPAGSGGAQPPNAFWFQIVASGEALICYGVVCFNIPLDTF